MSVMRSNGDETTPSANARRLALEQARLLARHLAYEKADPAFVARHAIMLLQIAFEAETPSIVEVVDDLTDWREAA
jgi:hypothetical protein